ncbi:MAG TPA: hypothetical protein VEV87_06785 [Chitinophagaceae bacterium]|nr:hypothetical protein [Chitinophagaceae bacterium]
MLKIVLIAGISLLAACNSGTKDEVASVAPNADSSAAASAENITYPYTAMYSSKFTIGDPKHAKLVLDLWKDWDNGDLSKSKDKFADSVYMYFWDGSKLEATRDSVIAVSQKFRDSYVSVTSSIDAFVALKSTDKDESWVNIWGKEIHTDKKGKVDSINLHEVWRINKDGKTDLCYQFANMPAKPKK